MQSYFSGKGRKMWEKQVSGDEPTPEKYGHCSDKNQIHGQEY